MNKGFTLIELLVVVIILGVVGVIAINNSPYKSFKERYMEKCVQAGYTTKECELII